MPSDDATPGQRLYSTAAVMTQQTPTLFSWKLVNGYSLALSESEAIEACLSKARETNPGWDVGASSVMEIPQPDPRPRGAAGEGQTP